jgi:glycosyltransferase involved in cell wall biosynthesis
MENNRITIAITVYERINFFEEALNSALSQTIQCPIIVVDNASSHNQFEKIIKQKNVSNVTYIRNSSNLGGIGNWNRCIELCQTQYLTILHDDDTLHPYFIEHCLNVLQNEGKDLCCVAVSELIGNDPSVLLKKEQSCVYKLKRFKTKHFLTTNLSSFPGVIFPVDVAKQLNGFDIDMYPINDYDFWVRLSENINVYRSNFIGAYYRRSEQQGSANVFYAVVDKIYHRRLQLYSQLGKVIYFVPYLCSLWSTYSLYIGYSVVYNKNILKGLENLQTPDLRKCFCFFYKTNRGIGKYFYNLAYKLFSIVFYNL